MKAYCTTCGKEFERRGNTKTCSVECSPTPYRPRKPAVGTCAICGKMFRKPTNSAITCDEECRRENTRRYMKEFGQRPDRQEKERERGQQRYQEELELRGPIMASCSICGAEYRKTSRSLTCSPGCREAYRAGEWARRFNGHAAGLLKKQGQPRSEIESFPDEINRESFGCWLSGFSDGEASFILRAYPDAGSGRTQCYAIFRISLRDDDSEVLRLIQSFLGCGTMSFQNNARSKIVNAKPVASFGVQRVADLVQRVIPHFMKHPLRAKKRHDFLIWCKGVELMWEVQSRQREGRGFDWSVADRATFAEIAGELRDQRRYASPGTST